MGSNTDRVRQWANLLAIVITFGLNVWSNLSPINGLTIGQISNTFFQDVKIIPANYAFAIWGIIYLGLFAFAIYQFRPSQRENPRLRRLGYWLVGAGIAQCIWIFLFLNRLFFGSLIAMGAILGCLILSYLKLEIGKVRVSKAESWFVDTPISIYLAWISVATIVNVAIAFYDLGWQGGFISPQVWTAILIVIGGIIAAILRIQRHEIAYPLVMIWAFTAVAIRQFDEPVIASSAIAVSLLLALQGFSSLLKGTGNRQ